MCATVVPVNESLLVPLCSMQFIGSFSLYHALCIDALYDLTVLINSQLAYMSRVVV